MADLKSFDDDGIAKAIESVRAVAKQSLDRVSTSLKLDDVCHNWGIAIAIFMGAIGTALPPSGNWIPASKVLTGLATAIFAVERSLEFGSRWVFHRRLRSGYQSVLTEIALIDAVSDSAGKREALKDAVAHLDRVSHEDSQIPGAAVDNKKRTAPANS